MIGRLGNFVNQELYGPPTSLCGTEYPPCLPFGIQIDAAHRAGTPWTVDASRSRPRPSSRSSRTRWSLNLVGMLLLLYVMRRFGPRLFAGDAALLYLMWYGGVRTLLETYRVNNWTLLGVPTAIWLGILAIVLAGAWFVFRHRRGWGTPMIKPADEPPPEAPAASTQPEASTG